MECPRCHLLLKKILVDENIYYKCPQCEGTLVHADRLRSLAEYTILELHIPEQPINPNHQEEVISPFALKEQAITCPYCQTETQLVNYGYDSNVIIEKCPACNTVWLDKDELLQIAKHLRGNTTLQRYGAALADVTEEQVRGAEEDQPNFIPAAVQSTIIPVPIGDERATKHPIIVYTIIGITSLLFFWQTFSGTNTENVFLTYGFVPALASNGERLFTLVTSLFFHVDIFHLLSNLFYLWLFGDNIEEHFGHGLFALFFVLSGVFANLTTLIFNPYSISPHIGASGAIAGILGAYLIVFHQKRIRIIFLGTIRSMSARTFLLVWITYQIAAALLYPTSLTAWYAHVGGFATGVFISWVLSRLNNSTSV